MEPTPDNVIFENVGDKLDVLDVRFLLPSVATRDEADKPEIFAPVNVGVAASSLNNFTTAWNHYIPFVKAVWLFVPPLAIVNVPVTQFVEAIYHR